jgi:hypothetical protein
MSGLDYIQVIRRITPWSTADHGNELTWVPFYTNWRTAIGSISAVHCRFLFLVSSYSVPIQGLSNENLHH